MAEVPIPSGLPRAPIRKQARPRPLLQTVDISAKSSFLRTLSQSALGWYNDLKQREALDQFDKGQNIYQDIFSEYTKDIREHPLEPDIELTKLNEYFNTADEQIKQLVTNGAAQQELKEWLADQKRDWTDTAMSLAHATDTQIKRSQKEIRHNLLIDRDITGFSEEQLIDLQDEIETNWTSGFNEELWMAKDLPRIQNLINTGKHQVELKFWRDKLLALPIDEFDAAIRNKDLPLSTQERRSIKSERDFLQEQALRERDKLRAETQTKLAKNVTDFIMNDDLAALQRLMEENKDDMDEYDYRRAANYLKAVKDLDRKTFEKLQEKSKEAELKQMQWKTHSEIIDMLTKAKTEEGFNSAEIKAKINELAAMGDLQNAEERAKDLMGIITAKEDPDNPLNRPAVKRAFNVLNELKGEHFWLSKEAKEEGYTPEDERLNLLKWQSISNDFEKWISENPTATDEEIEKKLKNITRPEVEKITLDLIDRLMLFKGEERKLLVKKKINALKEQGIWDELNEVERDTAREAFQRGMTVQDIIDALK